MRARKTGGPAKNQVRMVAIPARDHIRATFNGGTILQGSKPEIGESLGHKFVHRIQNVASKYIYIYIYIYGTFFCAFFPNTFAFLKQLCLRDEIARDRTLEDGNALYLKRLMNMES
jgi:hypothetical protein